MKASITKRVTMSPTTVRKSKSKTRKNLTMKYYQKPKKRSGKNQKLKRKKWHVQE